MTSIDLLHRYRPAWAALSETERAAYIDRAMDVAAFDETDFKDHFDYLVAVTGAAFELYISEQEQL